MKQQKYEIIIGLEIHVQLKTKSKMFCNCDNKSEGKKPNSCVCPICLGHPGVLPVLNKQAVECGILIGLALNAKINLRSKFDRKNYFYPDLPKGYQISQFDEPIVSGGFLEIEVDDYKKKIGLERLHLEEDAAKNFHSKDGTLVDFNRSGTPLAEIVTKPEFRSPEEAKIFLQDFRLLMRYLKVSDADMEKGQLRCDANISLRPVSYVGLYPKTEIKNMNSFRAVEKALTYEIKRQKKFFDAGMPIAEESTRGWDEKKCETVEQRTKEGFADYRYFPEPDLPPLEFTEDYVEKIRATLPELPKQKRNRFVLEYGFSAGDANILIQNNNLADYVEQVISELQDWSFALQKEKTSRDENWKKNKEKLIKLTAGWIINNLNALLNKKKIDILDCKITPENMAEFIALLFEAKMNSSSAQIMLEEMFDTGEDPTHIMTEKDLGQMSSADDLVDIVDLIIKNNPKQVEDYKRGKQALLKYFVGQVMKETKGKADPNMVEEILQKKLISVK